MSKRVLITGSTGFLAGYLIKELKKKRNYEVFGITDKKDSKSTTENTYSIDIRDREKLFEIIKTVKPDIVFHLAAITNVGFAWKNQKLTYEVNFIGSLNLLEALSENGFSKAKVIMMSSAEVYGNNEDAITESTAISIENPYSLSKYAMEMLADIFIRSKEMNIIKIRAFNFTGPGQDKKFVSSDFACQIAEIEKHKRPPVIDVGNLAARRDFSDVRDIARYIEVLSRLGNNGEVYNLSSGNLISIKEILDKLLLLTKIEIKVNINKEKFRPVDIPVLKADNSYIKKEFNLYPEFEMEKTLKNILDYWRNVINE